MEGSLSADAELIYIEESISSSIMRNRCQLPNYPHEIHSASGEVTQEGDIIVCGGLDQRGAKFRTCYRLNAEIWTWESTSNMRDQRYYPAVVRVNNDIFVIGGSNGTLLNTVEVYRDGAWAYVSPFPHPILFHCAVAINTTTLMVITGGGYVSN